MHSLTYQLKANPCCICGSNESKVIFPACMDNSSQTTYAFSARRKRDIQHFQIVRCGNCGLVRSDPILSYEKTLNLYRNSQFLYEKESEFAASKYFSLLKIVLARLTNDSQILEVGCGDGALLYQLFRAGYHNVQGVEPSHQAVSKSNGLIASLIKEQPFDPSLYHPESFSLIAGFHLLDHLHNPNTFVSDAHKLLTNKGFLFVACHNERALSARILKEQSPIYDVEHTFLFDKASLAKLLESNGFEILTLKSYWNTYPFEYWTRMLPFVRKYLDNFPSKIKTIKLSLPAGNMFVLAQKIAG